MFFAIPFFKNTEFLKKTLLSLKNQSDAGWVAVVLDDSIDPNESGLAQSVVSEFSDPRIEYRKNAKNIGMAKNWNQGLDLARDQGHELACILHADDCLKPEYVLKMKQSAQHYPDAVGLFCRTEIIDEDEELDSTMADAYKNFLLPKDPNIILKGLDGIEKLIPGNFIFCPSLCYRMPKIGNERFRDDLKMVTDFEFILRFLFNDQAWVGLYHDTLFQYRRHLKNTTVLLTQDLTRFHEEITLYRQTSERLKALGHDRLSVKAKKMTVIKLNLLFQITRSFMRLNFKSLRKESALLLSLFS